MHILKQVLSKEILEDNNTFSIINLYSENKIVVDKYPAKQDFTIGLWIANFDIKKNEFKMIVKDQNNIILAEGQIFRCNYLTSENIGFISTTVYEANFKNSSSFYIVEYLNFDEVIYSLRISSVTNWSQIYKITNDTGSIEYDYLELGGF